jgi:hypothetical protein
MILVAHVRDGDVGHPQDFGDVGIGVAIVGPQENPGAVALTCAFVTVGNIGGQALVFLWG